MPLAITPVRIDDGVLIFENNQESIADVYSRVVAPDAAVSYDESTSTWSLKNENDQDILAATLMPNEVQDPTLIGEMHRTAYALFGGMHLNGFPDRLLSLYISMVFPVAGIEAANFGANLSLKSGLLDNGNGTLLHNYYPGQANGMRHVLAGRIN